MITPPLSISARPLFTLIVPTSCIGTILAIRGRLPGCFYQALREKKPSRASTTMTTSTIQSSPMKSFPPFSLGE
jgi:hypothetical protein